MQLRVPLAQQSTTEADLGISLSLLPKSCNGMLMAPGARPWQAIGGLLLIFLGDFVADVAATYGAGNGCQGFAVAATDLIAQQPTNHSTHPNAKWAVLSYRSRRCRRRLRRHSGMLPSWFDRDR